MFLPVFDANSDTYDTLHERSPLAVNCICMVAARVRDGGGMSLGYQHWPLPTVQMQESRARYI